jgi:hypothetical protein
VAIGHAQLGMDIDWSCLGPLYQPTQAAKPQGRPIDIPIEQRGKIIESENAESGKAPGEADCITRVGEEGVPRAGTPFDEGQGERQACKCCDDPRWRHGCLAEGRFSRTPIPQIIHQNMNAD